MYNPDDIKARNNIVDVIGRHLQLKKSGKNYFACCPFHGEKTPSFSVNEEKQLFHCFGCGANGDVIDFVSSYSGVEFADACEMLGGQKEIEYNAAPVKKRVYYKKPDSHKEDTEFCEAMLKKAQVQTLHGIEFYKLRQSAFLPIYNAEKKIINLRGYDGSQSYFVAGGLSYNGFTPLIKNQKSSNFIVTTDLKEAREIFNKYDLNVAIAWSCHVKKYLCKWNSGELNLKPVITNNNDDYLAYEIPWLSWDGEKLRKEEVKNV